MHDHTISINIIHVCKSLLKFPRCPSLVNDPNMQELDHSRARANDLQKAQEEQLEEIIRISKELESVEPLVSLWFCNIGWSCKNRPYFCKFPLRLMNLRPDRSNSQRLTGSFFLMLMFRVPFAGARRMQRRDYPNAWSGWKIRGRDIPAR